MKIRWHSAAHRWHSAAQQVHVWPCITALEMACQLLHQNHRTDLGLWRDQQRAAWLDVCESRGTVYQVSNVAALATAQMVHAMAQTVRQKPIAEVLLRNRVPETAEAPASENTQVRPTPEPQIEAFGTEAGGERCQEPVSCGCR